MSIITNVVFQAELSIDRSINQSIVVYYRHDKMQANNIKGLGKTRLNKCSYITCLLEN